MIWPEKLTHYYTKKGYPDNCVEAANKMLDACKEAYYSIHSICSAHPPKDGRSDCELCNGIHETPNDIAFQQGYNAGYKDKKDLEDYVNSDNKSIFQEIIELKKDKRDLESHLESLRMAQTEGIRSMEDFQRKYFPNLVGKECPYCGSKNIVAQTAGSFPLDENKLLLLIRSYYLCPQVLGGFNRHVYSLSPESFKNALLNAFGIPFPKVLSSIDIANILIDAERLSGMGIMLDATRADMLATAIHKAQGGINICPSGVMNTLVMQRQKEYRPD